MPAFFMLENIKLKPKKFLTYYSCDFGKLNSSLNHIEKKRSEIYHPR